MIQVVPFDSGVNINTDQESVVKLVLNPKIVNLNNVSVAAVEETTMLGNTDRFFLWDSGWYSITWQNIVVRLKAYFDTIYSTFSGEHNDTTNRDAANSHPATAITVAEAVTPSYDLAEQGKNMQEVTEMVLGLQEHLIDLTTTEKVNAINITKDKNGDDINIGIGETIMVILDIPLFVDAPDSPVTQRASLRINNISSADTYTSLNALSTHMFLAGTSYASQRTIMFITNLGYKSIMFSQNNEPSNINGQNYLGYTNFATPSISEINVVMAGGQNMGTGTHILIRKL